MKITHLLLATLWGSLFAPQAQAVTCQDGIAPSNPDSAYTDHGDGTVTDNRSGLMWDQCPWGHTGSDCSGVSAGAGGYTWQDAFDAADSANTASHKGYNDWRLPNIRELESLTEECRGSPAINDTLFPNTPGWRFWSGSPLADNSHFAWYVDFDNGYAGNFPIYRTSYNSVHLVRGGQSYDAFEALVDVTAPTLSTVRFSGTTPSPPRLVGTSNEAATGYWMVVARDATAPDADQVKAGADYDGVMVVAQGSGTMSAGVAAGFSITGLAAPIDYDLYLVAQDGADIFSLVEKVQFTTTTLQFPTSANSYTIPTLGPWGLALLAGVLGLFGVRSTRRG